MYGIATVHKNNSAVLYPIKGHILESGFIKFDRIPAFRAFFSAT